MKNLIITLAVLFALPALAGINQPSVSPTKEPQINHLVLAKVKLDINRTPKTPSIVSEAGRSSGGFLKLSRQELAWNRDPQINLDLVVVKDGMIQVEENYFINPNFISYGGYQLAVSWAGK